MGLDMVVGSGFCYSIHSWDICSKGERKNDMQLVKVYAEPQSWLEWVNQMSICQGVTAGIEEA